MESSPKNHTRLYIYIYTHKNMHIHISYVYACIHIYNISLSLYIYIYVFFGARIRTLIVDPLRPPELLAGLGRGAQVPRRESFVWAPHLGFRGSFRKRWVRHVILYMAYPEGPSTHCLRTLVPNTIPYMAFGTRVLKYWVLGPSGIV